MEVEMAILGSPSQIVLMVSVDVMQHRSCGMLNEREQFVNCPHRKPVGCNMALVISEFASTTDYKFWPIHAEDLVSRQQLLALGTLKGG